MIEESNDCWSHFRVAVIGLGMNNKARALALGISERQLWTWVHQGPPRALRSTPSSVLRALADDVDAQQRLHHIQDQ